ncbi:MAG: hypothetical protein NVV62_16415 [Terricaulis sp.]|nr:hypothetical protein [Terricaulis sp.]
MPWFAAVMSRATQTQTFAFIVPANTYVLSNASAGGNIPGAQFCYGAPGFSAVAGDVVYIGEVYLQAGALQTDVYVPPAPFGLRIETEGLEAARGLLQQTPDIATRLRKADFQNGHTRACVPGLGTYGIDIPGAPWR